METESETLWKQQKKKPLAGLKAKTEACWNLPSVDWRTPDGVKGVELFGAQFPKSKTSIFFRQASRDIVVVIWILHNIKREIS